MADLTGGRPERIDLRKLRLSSDALFDVIYRMFQKGSMLSCDIQVID